jgi:hypothetical protein
MKSAIFRNVTPYSLKDPYRRFGGSLVESYHSTRSHIQKDNIHRNRIVDNEWIWNMSTIGVSRYYCVIDLWSLRKIMIFRNRMWEKNVVFHSYRIYSLRHFLVTYDPQFSVSYNFPGSKTSSLELYSWTPWISVRPLTKTKLRGRTPEENYTDRATAACQRN